MCANCRIQTRPSIWLPTVLVGLLLPALAYPHCDTRDGPVVTDAKAALDKGDVTGVLKWVPKEGEAEVRAAFDKTQRVRGLSAEARDLADTYFFETLVRIHRAGEGAPYTGLKPAGTPLEPSIAAADAAVESGSVNDVVKRVTEHVTEGIRDRFAKLQEARAHAEHTVEAGRQYVAAYVEFVHYVERLHHAARTPAAHHGEGCAAASAAEGQTDSHEHRH